MIKISSIYVSLLSECYRRHRKTVSYCQVHKIFLRSCIFFKTDFEADYSCYLCKYVNIYHYIALYSLFFYDQSIIIKYCLKYSYRLRRSLLFIPYPI